MKSFINLLVHFVTFRRFANSIVCFDIDLFKVENGLLLKYCKLFIFFSNSK